MGRCPETQINSPTELFEYQSLKVRAERADKSVILNKLKGLGVNRLPVGDPLLVSNLESWQVIKTPGKEFPERVWDWRWKSTKLNQFYKLFFLKTENAALLWNTLRALNEILILWEEWGLSWHRVSDWFTAGQVIKNQIVCLWSRNSFTFIYLYKIV